VRRLLADVLDQVRADPWAGQPMRGLPPEFRTVLFGERGVLTYLIRERQRVVLLLSVVWVQP